MTTFAAKNIVITGAASGIGRLLAERLAADAAHVILWDIDDARLKELADRLRGSGGHVSSYRCDVTQREAVYSTARRVLERSGSVDILINNAGVVTGKRFMESSDDEILHTFQVNALAPFWTTRAFLPAMIERDTGHVVNIASAAGLVGAPRLSDYCASKAAVIGFDESLRLELRRLGSRVRTTLACPFFVRTGMFAGVRTRFPWLLPIMRPEEVADRILRAVRSDRRRVIMPRFAYVAMPLRILPIPWFDWLLEFFGITRAMDGFTGRHARDDVRGALGVTDPEAPPADPGSGASARVEGRGPINRQ